MSSSSPQSIVTISFNCWLPNFTPEIVVSCQIVYVDKFFHLEQQTLKFSLASTECQQRLQDADAFAQIP